MPDTSPPSATRYTLLCLNMGTAFRLKANRPGGNLWVGPSGPDISASIGGPSGPEPQGLKPLRSSAECALSRDPQGCGFWLRCLFRISSAGAGFEFPPRHHRRIKRFGRHQYAIAKPRANLAGRGSRERCSTLPGEVPQLPNSLLAQGPDAKAGLAPNWCCRVPHSQEVSAAWFCSAAHTESQRFQSCRLFPGALVQRAQVRMLLHFVRAFNLIDDHCESLCTRKSLDAVRHGRSSARDQRIVFCCVIRAPPDYFSERFERRAIGRRNTRRRTRGRDFPALRAVQFILGDGPACAIPIVAGRGHSGPLPIQVSRTFVCALPLYTGCQRLEPSGGSAVGDAAGAL